MKVNFEVADVMRPLVAVGEMQKRGMTAGTPRKLRDSRPRDKATRRQPTQAVPTGCVCREAKMAQDSGSC